MVPITFSKLVLYFALFSVVGWVGETIWCSVGAKKPVNRGFLSGPYCPIYGFGALLIYFVASPLAQWPVLVFLVSLLATSALEYFTGWLLETLFKTRWWDYSDQRFQIKGRVCLLNSVIFGLLGLASVYWFEPWVSRLFGLITPATQRVLASVIIAVFVLDLARSLAVVTKLEEKLQGLRDVFVHLERYDNEYNWYDKSDLPGSMERLREACRRQEGDKTAAAILAGIEEKIGSGNGGLRIVKAYPHMQPRDMAAEFTALKEDWAAQRLRRKEEKNAAANRRREKWQRVKKQVAPAYKGVTFSRMVWVFTIGSVIGYVLETLYCLLVTGGIESRQGMVYGPFSQVYGFGAVVLVLVLSPFVKKGDGWVFLASAIAGGLFETLCSLVQEFVFGTVSWQYSHQPFALFGGRTSLMYMLFWGILGVLYMKFIYPKISELIDLIPKRPKRFFTWFLVIFLAADMLVSAAAVSRWTGRQNGIEPQNRIEVYLDERFPNEMLEEIYPHMQLTGEGGAQKKEAADE